MFFPIGDTPNPVSTPWLTRSLIAINVAVYLLVSLPLAGPLTPQDLQDPQTMQLLDRMWELQGPYYSASGIAPQVWLSQLSRYDLVVFQYGYVPAIGGLLSLLTCMFLHGGFLHLAGNMLYLWIFGDNVEARLGRVRYLLAYLLTGVAGTLAFAAFDTRGFSPLVGASGAISGVLGFYFIWFPHNRVRVFLTLWPFLFDVFLVRAYWALLFYFVAQNLFPALAGSGGGVAYGAHIGGFVAGAVLAKLLAGWLPDAETREEDFGQRTRVGLAGPPPPPAKVVDPPGARFARLIREGRMQEASASFARAVERGDPVAVPDAVALGEWLLQRGEAVTAEAVYRHLLRGRPPRDAASLAHLRLGEILASTGRQAAARAHLLDCLDQADRDSEVSRRARALLDVLGDGF